MSGNNRVAGVSARASRANYLPDRPLRFPGILVGGLIFSSVWANIGPRNASPVDALLLFILLLYLPAVWGLRNDRFTEIGVRLGTPVLAYLLLGLLLLIFVGGDWLQLVKDALSFAYLFVVLAVLLKTKKAPDFRPAFVCLYAAILALAATTLTVAEGARATGFGKNANTPAIWLAGAAVVLLVAGRPKNVVLRLSLFGVATFALLQTSSMGGLVALFAGTAFWLFGRQYRPMSVKLVASAAASALGFLLLPYLTQFTKVARETGADRTERSRSARETIWRSAWDHWLENPMGEGPGGFAKSGTETLSSGRGYETHNDYLGVLGDYGLFGILIFLLLLFRLFTVASRTQPLVVTMAVWAATHSGINMRSTWIFLGLVLAFDYWSSTDSKSLPGTGPASSTPAYQTQAPT